MQGQGNTGHQKMDEEENKYYLEAPDTQNPQQSRFGNEAAGGSDWPGNADTAGSFGRRKNSEGDYGGQGSSRGRDGPGQRAIGVNRRSRSRSQSKERNSSRFQDNQDDGDKTIEDDRRFIVAKSAKPPTKPAKHAFVLFQEAKEESSCIQKVVAGPAVARVVQKRTGNTTKEIIVTILRTQHLSIGTIPMGRLFFSKSYGQKLFKKDPSSSPDREKERGHQGQSGYSAEKPTGRGGANVANRKGGNNARNKSQDSESGESDSRSYQSNHNERQAFQTHESFGLGALIQNQYHKYPPLFGFGIPLRTQNYIMGETKPLGGNNPSN